MSARNAGGGTSAGGTGSGGRATVTSWQANQPGAGTPWAPAAAPGPVEPQVIPVVWLGRTSTEESQDPTLSLPRQLKNSRAALPAGCVIVGHFYDVESGRLELDQRGHGVGHQAFNIPIPRDGGIADLLEEAGRPDRRFVAVICESIERVARRTYFGTKIEYELERAGVALWAADEPINAAGGAKKATPILTRRVKQAVAEWYVLQMLELSWDGLSEHTRQGWNIGKPPYGYLAEKIPHPVAARRAEGRTKHRLVPDPTRGAVVTTIFQWRALERLGYDAIATRLNLEPDRYPPPEPTRSDAALGRWTGSAVREILINPKYTGYMVWNRRSSKDKIHPGKVNPRADWVWSPHPVHEPLITRELFDAVTPTARARQGSRSKPGPNIAHPHTQRAYLLRSYVVCDLCGRRMFGKTRRGGSIAYYTCQPDARQHSSADWYADHPRSIYVREDQLSTAVHDFFATRVFGPHRHDLLASDLGNQPADANTDNADRRHADLDKQIAQRRRRQQQLITELEALGDDLDPDVRKELRAGIQERFADLTRQRKALEAERETIAQRATQNPHKQDPALLDQLPRLAVHLEATPDDLQRALYDAYRLQVRYNRRNHDVTLQVTITADALPTLTAAAHAMARPFGHRGTATGVTDKGNSTGARNTTGDVAHVLGAPGRIRTCAPASGVR